MSHEYERMTDLELMKRNVPVCPDCNATSYGYEEINRVGLGDYMERIYFRATCDGCGRVEKKLSTEASVQWGYDKGQCHSSARRDQERRKLRAATCTMCKQPGRSREANYLCGMCHAYTRMRVAERDAKKWRERYETIKKRRSAAQ